ncbi:hypothetical protein ACQW5G_04030 [Fructilactobacillus sp. Tb1]|uniref:hypothetical protein n=1 Tax=Fructilactobacillus sp. Tb1 TaxID=3422304 RepID=UPI003D2DC457
MKNLKRIALLLSTVTIAVSLAACGSENSTKNDKKDNTKTEKQVKPKKDSKQQATKKDEAKQAEESSKQASVKDTSANAKVDSSKQSTNDSSNKTDGTLTIDEAVALANKNYPSPDNPYLASEASKADDGSIVVKTKSETEPAQNPSSDDDITNKPKTMYWYVRVQPVGTDQVHMETGHWNSYYGSTKNLDDDKTVAR